MEKNHEMMKPLEDDELEEATGGMITFPLRTCSKCNTSYQRGIKCPKCGNQEPTPDNGTTCFLES